MTIQCRLLKENDILEMRRQVQKVGRKFKQETFGVPSGTQRRRVPYLTANVIKLRE
jgi:hypothetical protein